MNLKIFIGFIIEVSFFIATGFFITKDILISIWCLIVAMIFAVYTGNLIKKEGRDGSKIS